MAFLQSEIPPSTAPVAPSRTVWPRIAAVAPRPAPSRLFARLSVVLIVAALLAIPGYAAARATESLAIGILAADFAFLLAVAGWSAVAGDARR